MMMACMALFCISDRVAIPLDIKNRYESMTSSLPYGAHLGQHAEKPAMSTVATFVTVRTLSRAYDESCQRRSS